MSEREFLAECKRALARLLQAIDKRIDTIDTETREASRKVA